MSEELICCDRPTAKAKSKTTGVFTVSCSVCHRAGAGPTEAEAIADFKRKQTGSKLPVRAGELPEYMASHITDLRALTIPFLANDRPALTSLIKRNIRYVMTRKEDPFQRCWQTPEGQESIVFALEEALSLGAELGKTGSLVPYSGAVEFIPAVEAYEFALTNGKNPPFKWIQIDMIHENDQRDVSRVNGEFTCKVRPMVPRGELVGVAVYGYSNRLGHVIGELYDVGRLLGKAEQHSASYRAYLNDLRAFDIARTEGRVKVDVGGREYAEVVIADETGDKYAAENEAKFRAAEKEGKLKKDGRGDYVAVELPKKGGGTWTKKIYRSEIENPGTKVKFVYRDDIKNPYEGPDQPEMLRKAAGKSFLGKYARVRGAESAMEESIKGDDVEGMVDASIDRAFQSFDSEAIVVKAEDIRPDDVPAESARDEPTDAELAEELSEYGGVPKQEEIF